MHHMLLQSHKPLTCESQLSFVIAYLAAEAADKTAFIPALAVKAFFIRPFSMRHPVSVSQAVSAACHEGCTCPETRVLPTFCLLSSTGVNLGSHPIWLDSLLLGS